MSIMSKEFISKAAVPRENTEFPGRVGRLLQTMQKDNTERRKRTTAKRRKGQQRKREKDNSGNKRRTTGNI